MEKAMYRAAMEGNIDFLREVRDREIETGCWNKHLLGSQTSQKNNIIHIASKHDQYEFLKNSFSFFNISPLMIASTNAKGDTPLHVASKMGNNKIVKLLVEAFNELVFREVEILNEFGGVASHEAAEGEENMPWRVKNLEGNTPLHEALINGKIEVATYLVEVDPSLASFVNNNKETPLHLAIKYNVDGDKQMAIDTIELMNKQQASLCYKGSKLEEDSMSIIKLLLRKSKVAVNIQDKDGLTPLLKAAIHSHFRAIESILDEYPECLDMCDPMGKTVLHLLKFQGYKEAKEFFQKNPGILSLKDEQDNMGNTPAHIAIMNCIERISKASKVDGEQDASVTMKFQSCEEAMKFMKKSQELSLKGNVGNTPKSSVIVMNCVKNITDEQNVKKDHDIIGVIRAMLESSANFSLKNKEGLSATALFKQVRSHLSCTRSLPERNIEIEGLLAENNHQWMYEKKLMEDVENGNVNSLTLEAESCMKKGCLNITNLLYKLLKACEIKHSDDTTQTMKCASCFTCNHRKMPESPTTKSTCCYQKIEGLINELFKTNPLYIYDTNSRGETPLHMMVQFQNFFPSESLLNQIKQSYEKADELGVYCPPWRVKNMEGNTPIHEALFHFSLKKKGVIKFLMDCEPKVFHRDKQECDRNAIEIYLNNQRETPLHVFCGSKENVDVDDEAMIKEILEANRWATIYRDACGLTPLLRAAKNGQIEVVKQIWEISQESAQLCDCKGQTFWHMMNMPNSTKEQEKDLIKKAKEIDSIKTLSSATDNAGKTPLVRAIDDHNYNLAQVLSKITERSVNEVLTKQPVSMRYTLFILSIASHLPSQLEKELWKKMKKLGVKSLFGVPKSEISGYTNTIGVIAALLATIAFQGAFAVPGGYDSSKGSPVLFEKYHNLNQKDAFIQFLRISAFWVFMVADILTMCLSMMVLFCLQWILTGNDKEKFVITDLCLFLLNLAFMTTFIAFMMGVFASNYHMESTLAIFTVAVCSTVMLLLQKNVVMMPLQYVFLTGYLGIAGTCRYVVSSTSAKHEYNRFKTKCNQLLFNI